MRPLDQISEPSARFFVIQDILYFPFWLVIAENRHVRVRSGPRTKLGWGRLEKGEEADVLCRWNVLGQAEQSVGIVVHLRLDNVRPDVTMTMLAMASQELMALGRTGEQGHQTQKLTAFCSYHIVLSSVEPLRPGGVL